MSCDAVTAHRIVIHTKRFLDRSGKQLTIQKQTGATFEAAGRAGSAQNRPESEICLKNKQGVRLAVPAGSPGWPDSAPESIIN